MGKWKGMIVWTLIENPCLRYGELKRMVMRTQKISDKVLIETLKELESDGLVLRKDFKEIPPKVEYSLSKRGKELKPIFESMYTFGERYIV